MKKKPRSTYSVYTSVDMVSTGDAPEQAPDMPVRTSAVPEQQHFVQGQVDMARTVQRKDQKAAYRWNTIAGLLHTSQSVLMLVVITRVLDITEAGVFTIAFAVANLFMHIGMYGVRKFQASDRCEEFSFREYRAARVITSLAMVVAGGAYIAGTSVALGYTTEKTLVISVMVLFKVIDVVEDVYSGAYQQQDHFGMGQFMVSMRQVFTLTLFAVVAVLSANLLTTMVIITLASAGFFVGQVLYVRRRYALPNRTRGLAWARVRALLRQCFPLFVAAFLLFYIGNAPKYVIDALMSDADQAIYGYIAMPVFAVNILTTFVYNPMITELTDLWHARKVRPFLLRFGRVALVVLGITAACVVLAALFGIPVLNLLYNTNVAPWLAELLILVAGGGFLALATLATVGITIIRFQRVLVPLYGAMALLAWAVAQGAVAAWGITGASWAYFGTMGAVAVVFVTAFLYGVKKLA